MSSLCIARFGFVNRIVGFVDFCFCCAGLKSAKSKKGTSDPHLIPPDTRVEVKLEPNEAAHCVELLLKTTTYTVIQLVSVFNDQIFEGESLVTVRAAPLIPLTRRPAQGIPTNCCLVCVVTLWRCCC